MHIYNVATDFQGTMGGHCAMSLTSHLVSNHKPQTPEHQKTVCQVCTLALNTGSTHAYPYSEESTQLEECFKNKVKSIYGAYTKLREYRTNYNIHTDTVRIYHLSTYIQYTAIQRTYIQTKAMPYTYM